MAMNQIPFILASALSLAPLAGCSSRQRPAEYPATSAASPRASTATPAVVTQSFQDDLAFPAAAPTSGAPESAAPTPQEDPHAHHHH